MTIEEHPRQPDAGRPVRRWRTERGLTLAGVAQRSGLNLGCPAGERTGTHTHAGDEHHLGLRGRWRLTLGDHVVEEGQGVHSRRDGTFPRGAEAGGDGEGAMLIVSLRLDR